MLSFSTECALQFFLSRCRTKLSAMILTFTFFASFLFTTVWGGMIFLTTFSALLRLLWRLSLNQCPWLLGSHGCCYMCLTCHTCDLWKRYPHRWDLGYSLTYRWRTAMSTLSCVVDTKLTSVTGCFCICSALDSELSVGCSMVFTGVGLL